MTAKTDRILRLFDDTDETAEVARNALDLLGIDQIVALVLELDETTKADVFEALANAADQAAEDRDADWASRGFEP